MNSEEKLFNMKDDIKQNDSIKDVSFQTSPSQNPCSSEGTSARTTIDTMLLAIDNAEKVFNTITSKDNTSALPKTKKHLFVKNENSCGRRKIKKLHRVYTNTSPITGSHLRSPVRAVQGLSALPDRQVPHFTLDETGNKNVLECLKTMSSSRPLRSFQDENSDLETTIFDCTLSPNVSSIVTPCVEFKTSRLSRVGPLPPQPCVGPLQQQHMSPLQQQCVSPLPQKQCVSSLPQKQFVNPMSEQNNPLFIDKTVSCLISKHKVQGQFNADVSRKQFVKRQTSVPHMKTNDKPAVHVKRRQSIKFDDTTEQTKRRRISRASSLRDVWRNTVKQRTNSEGAAGCHEGEGRITRGNAGHTPKLTRRKSCKTVYVDERLI